MDAVREFLRPEVIKVTILCLFIRQNDREALWTLKLNLQKPVLTSKSIVKDIMHQTIQLTYPFKQLNGMYVICGCFPENESNGCDTFRKLAKYAHSLEQIQIPDNVNMMVFGMNFGNHTGTHTYTHIVRRIACNRNAIPVGLSLYVCVCIDVPMPVDFIYFPTYSPAFFPVIYSKVD